MTGSAGPGARATAEMLATLDEREARWRAEQLATAMEAVGLWDLNGEPTEPRHEGAAAQPDAKLRICSCPCRRRGHHAVCVGLASLTVEISGVPAEVCLPCALAQPSGTSP